MGEEGLSGSAALTLKLAPTIEVLNTNAAIRNLEIFMTSSLAFSCFFLAKPLTLGSF